MPRKKISKPIMNAFTFKGIPVFVSLLCFFCVTQITQAQTQIPSTAMNPNVGANFILEAENASSHSADGFRLREAEFSFKSDVDPYFTANMIFSVAEGAPGEYGISPEEVYVDTTSLPSLTIRAGKFYNYFGKQNRLHTHAYPFIDVPLINDLLLGGGLNTAGISASYLIPTSFFSEITLQGMQNFRSLVHLRSVFDSSDFSTFELGVTGVTNWAYGVDLTFKFRPTDRGLGRRINISGEWMSGQLDGFTQNPEPSGLPTQGFDVYGQLEFASRTYFQYRFDDVVSHNLTRHAVMIGYAPSEFSVLRIQADRAFSVSTIPENRVIAQVNFTIGFHPSHDY